MKGLAGVVILFNPDQDVLNRLHSYSVYVEKLYVIDNSVIPLNWQKDLGNIVYLHDGDNKGISERLNQAGNHSFQEGFKWLLTMDQDSSFTPENIHNYISCLQSFPDKAAVSVFGVQHENAEIQNSNCFPIETNLLITSGSILNLEVFKTIGGFDENLFIDQVDYEYSFRSNINKYKTIQFRNIFLVHSLGKQSMHFSLKNFKKTKRSLHAPIRIYYMTRNYLYIKSKYKKLFPAEIKHMKKDLINRLKNNLLYNPEKINILRNLIAGVLDFSKNKMGRKSEY